MGGEYRKKGCYIMYEGRKEGRKGNKGTGGKGMDRQELLEGDRNILCMRKGKGREEGKRLCRYKEKYHLLAVEKPTN